MSYIHSKTSSTKTQLLQELLNKNTKNITQQTELPTRQRKQLFARIWHYWTHNVHLHGWLNARDETPVCQQWSYISFVSSYPYVIEHPYNMAICCQNAHKRRPIARPWGQAMECLLWVLSLIHIQHFWLSYHTQCHVISDHIRRNDCVQHHSWLRKVTKDSVIRGFHCTHPFSVMYFDRHCLQFYGNNPLPAQLITWIITHRGHCPSGNMVLPAVYNVICIKGYGIDSRSKSNPMNYANCSCSVGYW